MEINLMIFVGVVVVLLAYHAVSIRRLKQTMGEALFENEKELLKTIDIGEQIHDLGNKMLKIDDQDTLLNLILEKTIDVIDNAERGSIMFLKSDGHCEFVASVGFDLEKLSKVVFHVEDTFIYECTNGKLDSACIMVNVLDFNKERDLNQERNRMLKEARVEDIQTTLSVPIIVDQKVYGVINLDSSVPNAFSEKDIAISEVFVAKASMAIKNHLLLQEIIMLSRFDTLTGVYNRRHFEALMEQSIERGIQSKEHFFVVLFDLNGFKRINDTYGHLAGDGLIKHFASHMQEIKEDADVFARYGGDEFAGLFYNITEDALKEKLKAVTKWFDENLYPYGSDSLKCSFSYGIAEFGTDGVRYDELIKKADDRMYRYKRGLQFHGK